ncbi:hypothetical protein [Vibrio maritimus]|uniref:hypothetical protein n=1 Tax=Vibrio maritimus TaxID=990268 RepID=UPI003736EAB4
MTTETHRQLLSVIAELRALDTFEPASLSALQLRHPAIALTLCWQDELVEREPYVALSNVEIHLVASATHQCSTLTFDLAASNGLLIALQD